MRTAALLVVPLIACTGAPTAPSVAPPAVGTAGSVTVVMSGRVEAELEPCG